MSSWEDGYAKLLAALQKSSPTDMLGAGAAAVGVILVVFGIVLQENQGVDFGATIRALGGVLLLGGLAAVLFWESHRRAAVIGAARRIAGRYMAATADWRWPDRVGMAGVVVGLVLPVPALVFQILFGTAFGVMFITPGIMLFWCGIAFLVYGRFYGRNATRKPPQSRSRRGGRGRGP